VTLEGPLAGVLRRAAYLYRQPTDQACALCFMHLPSPFTLPVSTQRILMTLSSLCCKREAGTPSCASAACVSECAHAACSAETW